MKVIPFVQTIFFVWNSLFVWIHISCVKRSVTLCIEFCMQRHTNVLGWCVNTFKMRSVALLWDTQFLCGIHKYVWVNALLRWGNTNVSNTKRNSKRNSKRI